MTIESRNECLCVRKKRFQNVFYFFFLYICNLLFFLIFIFLLLFFYILYTHTHTLSFSLFISLSLNHNSLQILQIILYYLKILNFRQQIYNNLQREREKERWKEKEKKMKIFKQKLDFLRTHYTQRKVEDKRQIDIKLCNMIKVRKILSL